MKDRAPAGNARVTDSATPNGTRGVMVQRTVMLMFIRSGQMTTPCARRAVYSQAPHAHRAERPARRPQQRAVATHTVRDTEDAIWKSAAIAR